MWLYAPLTEVVKIQPVQLYDPDGTRVEPDIPCVDTWPPRTLTEASIQAYKRMNGHGVRIQSISTNRRTGVITVRYLTDFDHEWTLRELKRVRAKIIEECSEQVKL